MVWKIPLKLAQRILRKCEITKDNCWLYRGALRKGYGSVKVGGRTESVHRVMYEIACGPISEGLQIDHLCRNTSCCNPKHLEPVTVKENIRRGLHGKLQTHCKHGHLLPDYDGNGRRVCNVCKKITKRVERKRNSGLLA